MKGFLIRASYIALLCALVFLYYRAQWSTWQEFSSAIDTCEQLFCDYVNFYFPMGQTILSQSWPVHGFFYSAFFALMLSLLPMTETPQITLWLAIQTVLYIGLFLVTLSAALKSRLPILALATVIFLTSYPILHNFKWGQVGFLITLLVIACLMAYQAGYKTAAALLLATATAIKYYPAIFVVFFLLRKDGRFLLSFFAFVILLLVLVPVWVLGLSETITFHKTIHHHMVSWFLGAVEITYGTQFFDHVLTRSLSALLSLAQLPPPPPPI